LKSKPQTTRQSAIAELMLSGRIKDGDQVVISARKQGLTFNGQLAEAA
jgi:ATP-dependent Clp protease ATP-binding subunit ClpB